MILFFDTETTGLPLDWRAPMTKVGNWPRVIQLGWQLYSEAGQLIEESADLILPDGWVMPVDKFWVDNGYSQEKSEKEGIPIGSALESFTKQIKKADLLVAHNISFDHNVLGAEYIRASMTTGKVIKKFCTKESSTDIVKIPSSRGYKWPTLTELHTFLFGCGFEGAHDALDDVKATAKSYFELSKRNLI